MTTCLAAVYRGVPNEVELCHLDVPTLRSGEILVRTEACTICGSDLHTFSGRRSTPVPTILGHEMVGRIAGFGDAAPRQDIAGRPLREGDRVTWAIVASCGCCFTCRRELPQKCEHAVKYGHIAFEHGYELSGGYAEYCVLAPGSAVMRLPDDMPLEVACPANCATGTAAAAVAAAGCVEDRSCCVLGVGLVGLTAAAMLARAGARHVVCVDPNDARRSLASRFGASHVARPDQLDALGNDLTGSRGFDVVIECAGPSANFSSALHLVRLGGTIVLVGSTYPDVPVPIQVDQIVRRNLTIRGVHNYTPADLHQAVNFLADNHRALPFAEVVHPWIPLPEIGRAFALAAQARSMRVGVTMNA